MDGGWVGEDNNSSSNEPSHSHLYQLRLIYSQRGRAYMATTAYGEREREREVEGERVERTKTRFD